jgi:hypothetical protein
MALDTGATITVITPQVAIELGFDLKDLPTSTVSLPPSFGQKKALVKVDSLGTFSSFPGIFPNALSGGGLVKIVSFGIDKPLQVSGSLILDEAAVYCKMKSTV